MVLVTECSAVIDPSIVVLNCVPRTSCRYGRSEFELGGVDRYLRDLNGLRPSGKKTYCRKEY